MLVSATFADSQLCMPTLDKMAAASPSDSVMKMKDPKEQSVAKDWDLEQRDVEVPRRTSVMNVLIAGLALFSDGYNAQISMFSIPVTIINTDKFVSRLLGTSLLCVVGVLTIIALQDVSYLPEDTLIR